jgi:hypothetical protein
LLNSVLQASKMRQLANQGMDHRLIVLLGGLMRAYVSQAWQSKPLNVRL